MARGWHLLSGMESPARATLRGTIGPSIAVLATLLLVPLLVTTATQLDGSLRAWMDAEAWRMAFRQALPTGGVVLRLFGFVALELVLLVGLPGPVLVVAQEGGRSPRYRLNGLAAFVVTHALLLGGWALGWSPAWLYDHLGGLLGTASILALGLCAYVYARGLRGPPGVDRGGSGYTPFDFFWGTELYPTLGGIELKQLCNSRLGMMGWSVLCVGYLAKQHALYGRISSSMWAAAGLQLAYVALFFAAEKRYYTSLDVAYDRFGYYIGWGVLCWLPALYPIAPLFLVTHPLSIGWVAPVLVVAGLGAASINWTAEVQRTRVRTHVAGAQIWGKPPRVVEARYLGSDGREHRSTLLASGWWGLARHFRYVPELGIAIAWTLPCGFFRLLPWLYPIFLGILLVHRANRVERRCATKYGSAWRAYAAAVPYKLIPGVY